MGVVRHAHGPQVDVARLGLVREQQADLGEVGLGQQLLNAAQVLGIRVDGDVEGVHDIVHHGIGHGRLHGDVGAGAVEVRGELVARGLLELLDFLQGGGQARRDELVQLLELGKRLRQVRLLLLEEGVGGILGSHAGTSFPVAKEHARKIEHTSLPDARPTHAQAPRPRRKRHMAYDRGTGATSYYQMPGRVHHARRAGRACERRPWPAGSAPRGVPAPVMRCFRAPRPAHARCAPAEPRRIWHLR